MRSFNRMGKTFGKERVRRRSNAISRRRRKKTFFEKEKSQQQHANFENGGTNRRCRKFFLCP